MVILKFCHGRKSQLNVLCQVMTSPCCRLVVKIMTVGSYLLWFFLVSEWSSNNAHSRKFLCCSWFYGKDCKLFCPWNITSNKFLWKSPKSIWLLFVNQKQSIINVYKWQLTLKLAAAFLGLGHNLCILHCHRQYYQGPTRPRIINWPTKALETEVPSLRSQYCQ